MSRPVQTRAISSLPHRLSSLKRHWGREPTKVKKKFAYSAMIYVTFVFMQYDRIEDDLIDHRSTKWMDSEDRQF